MKVGLRRLFVAVGVATGLMAPAPSFGGALDPTAFVSLGDFPSLSGAYVINTTGSPTLTLPGGMTLTGSIYYDSPTHSVAVFDFSSINLTAGQTITATGSLPVVLLSRSNATIGGSIHLDGSLGSSGAGGGSVSNAGPGSGQFNTAQGGGSGFGGAGGTSGVFRFNSGSSISAIAGGAAYGNLATYLVGGSYNQSGAGAGGGIEIGAVGALNVLAGGSITANGTNDPIFGGGGSGGGIFLHANAVSVATGASLSAKGGNGGLPGPIGGPGGGSGGGGGGGGGGQILVQYTDVFNSLIALNALNVGGGIGLGRTTYTGGINDGGNGTTSLVQTFAVPEPSSIVLVATAGLLALTGTRLRDRRPVNGRSG